MIDLLDQAIAHLQASKGYWRLGKRSAAIAEIAKCDRVLRSACRVYVERSVEA